MNLRPSMRNSSEKRVRFDTTAAPLAEKLTPMAAAKKSLANAVASLQPQLAPILNRLGTTLLLHLNKQHVKTCQLKKYEDEGDGIPISAKVMFKLNCSKLVEKDVEYLNLSEKSDTDVNDFRMTLRNNIIATIKIEEKAHKNATHAIFATQLRMLVKAALLCNDATKSTDVDKFVITILRLYHEKLLIHVKLTAEEFKDIYKKEHTLTDLPAPFVTTLATDNDENPPPNSDFLNQILIVWRIVEEIFITPWNQYLSTEKRNTLELELKNLHDEFFKPKKNDDAAMIIDSETPVDPEIMKGIIKKEVNKANQKLSKEITSLKSLLHQKNLSRGKSSAGKKKTGKKSQQKQNQQKPKEAEGNSNATAAGRKKTQTKQSSKKSSTKKKKNSKSKKNKSRSRETRN